MAYNEYIDRGCENDCHNDINVIDGIKTHIHKAIKHCVALADNKAMAYYPELPESVINALDDILAEIIQPIEDKADEGAIYYEHNGS